MATDWWSFTFPMPTAQLPAELPMFARGSMPEGMEPRMCSPNDSLHGA